MEVRLRDVAERAGVSVKTVSNVVHDYVHVAPPTRHRVQAALEELNYRPNLSARTLRRGRSGVIALALPALDMPYFAELTRFVVEAAGERGWTVLVDQTDGLREREQVVAAGVRGRLIDGLILSPLALGSEDLGRPGDPPLVLLGEQINDGAADQVGIDNVEAARVATTHLLDLERCRLGAIGYQDASESQSGMPALRQRGYESALEGHGLPLDTRLAISVNGYRRTDGAAAMSALLDQPRPPDAVFCFNDLLALGALRVLKERGVRVPEDLAVIGLDDIEDGRFSSPSLSTIAPDKEAIARIAVEMLQQRITSGTTSPQGRVTVDFALVVRESTVASPPQPPHGDGPTHA